MSKQKFRFTQLVSLIVASGLVVGCSTLKLMRFEAAPNSGQAVGDIELLLPASTAGTTPMADRLTEIPGAADAFTKNCIPQAEVAPAVALILPVLGELLFGFAMDYESRKVDDLEAASEASYAIRTSLTSSSLAEMVKAHKCLTILRYDPLTTDGKTGVKSKRLAMAAILKLAPVLDGRSDAFSIQPVFVTARNSAALTQASPQPAVVFGFAITLKGLAKQQNGLPTITSFGEASTSAPKVPIAEGQSACVTKKCAISEPLPILKSPNEFVVVNIGITEKGSLGFDADVAKAQLSAIKAALGPVTGDLIKNKLDKSSE